jgi:hypothetical protein
MSPVRTCRSGTVADLTELGGEIGRHRPPIAVAFPDLPPDPGHHARVAELSQLARRHGGRYAGFGA